MVIFSNLQFLLLPLQDQRHQILCKGHFHQVPEKPSKLLKRKKGKYQLNVLEIL